MSFFQRLKAAASAEWNAYAEHPFTNGIGNGSLPEAAFRHYLVQDYLFLIEFTRAYAIALYKSPTLADMREAAAGISAILDVEMELHVKMCGGWGLSPEDLERTPPAAEMLAYTRYVLDTGMRGDLLSLKVALAPCVIGYAEIATRLAAHPGALDTTNPYCMWISEYASSAYQQVAAASAPVHCPPEQSSGSPAPPARRPGSGHALVASDRSRFSVSAHSGHGRCHLTSGVVTTASIFGILASWKETSASKFA